MRMTAIMAAIASCTVILSVQSAHADALSPVELAFEQQTPSLLEDFATTSEQIKEETANKTQQEEEPEKYEVKKGDTLITIAKDFETDWTSLFFKNTNIEHPDNLDVGDTIIIPKKDEKLKEREIPALYTSPEPVQQQSSLNSSTTPASQPQTATRASAAATQTKAKSQPRGNVAGNLYSYGYCTWYVKNLRPDLPNNLGNADTWAARARAQGYATGSTPRVGAVAQATTGYMHVAYVSAVHGDGTITVREMNFKGWNVASTRVTSAANFVYIY